MSTPTSDEPASPTSSLPSSPSSSRSTTNLLLSVLSIIGLIGSGYAFQTAHYSQSGVLAIVGFSFAALRLHRSVNWQPFSFSFWVLAFVAAAFAFPQLFDKWGASNASSYVGILIQIIMFGMGATLSIQDFARVLVRPKAVFIGMLLQFTIMPFTGWLLTKVFSLPPQVAAGVVLIGACPGGVASNVITYLARGDVALSVTMTACSTLMAPVMTPLMMRWLGGELIHVDVGEMLMSILMMVIVPTVGGWLCNAILVACKWRGEWVDRLLSAMAMLAICVVIGIIVAGARTSLVSVGPLIIVCAMIHNSVGYTLGYWGAKALRLSESEARTISIEVGMQNGGMGSALAVNVLHSVQASLAPAIFGAWMSIAGSVLASYWRRKGAAD